MNASKRQHIALRTAAAVAAALLLAGPTASKVSAASDEKFFSSKAAGTSSADFLNLSVGARAAAMGGAYAAVSEDASAAYWNPAGLAQVNKFSAVFMRAQYVEDISYQYAAYAHRLSFDSVMAGSVLLTDIGSIDRTDMNNKDLGTFSPRDQVFALSYSKAILELSDKDMDVSMGVSAKYINSTIVESAKSYAADFGIMTYNFSDIPYRLALNMSNLGSGMKYDTESNPLPLTFKLAGSVNPFKNMLFSTDIVLPKQNKPNLLLGGEVSTTPSELTRLSVRAGFNVQRMRDGISGFSAGVGAAFNAFSLDYAFVPMGELGSTHRISITFDFPFRKPIFERRDRSIFTKMAGS